MEHKVLSKRSKQLMENKWAPHSDEKKYQAVVSYTQVGSLRAVSLAMGIPYQTIKEWHGKDWWKSIEDDILSQKKVKLTGQIEKVRDKAVNVVEDRLDNGDYFYDQKSGELIRRPVSADSAARILSSTMTASIKLEELRQNEKRIETQEKTQDRLTKLKLEFAKFAKATQIEGEKVENNQNMLEVQGGETSEPVLEEEREESETGPST